jgi:regulator of sigma E protease
MQGAWNIIQVIILFSILVIGHEYGHFIAAKLTGMRVDEFAVGFGKRLWGKQVGETLYSINLIPLGGYNRIYGMDIEDEDNGNGNSDVPKPQDYSAAPADDPRAFINKPLLSRFLVVIAGPIANLLIAVLVIFLMGVTIGFPAAEIGGVIPGGPADQAGIAKNDIITHLDGVRLTSTFDLKREIALSAHGSNQAVYLKGIRNNNTFDTSVIPQPIRMVDTYFCRLGFVYFPDGTVRYIIPGSPAERSGLHPGDIIVDVDGLLFPSSKLDIDSGSGIVDLQIYRDYGTTSLEMPYFENELNHEYYSRYGFFLDDQMTVTNVVPDGIADDSGLAPGDIIVDSSRSTWEYVSSMTPLADIQPLHVTYDRSGVLRNIILQPDRGLSRIQVYMDDASYSTLIKLPVNHPLYAAGLRSGDTIVSVNGEDTGNGIVAFVNLSKNMGNDVTIVAMAGTTQKVVDISIPSYANPEAARQFLTGLHFKTRYFRPNPAESFYAGSIKSWGIMVLIVDTITKLVSGQASVNELAGPVGIATITFQAASNGLVEIIDIMVLLSINLAIFNLLPFPALDGGRIVFMALEGIFRRPVVTVKIENLIHIGGFALLILFALFITYHDIVRILFGS